MLYNKVHWFQFYILLHCFDVAGDVDAVFYAFCVDIILNVFSFMFDRVLCRWKCTLWCFLFDDSSYFVYAVRYLFEFCLCVVISCYRIWWRKSKAFWLDYGCVRRIFGWGVGSRHKVVFSYYFGLWVMVVRLFIASLGLIACSSSLLGLGVVRFRCSSLVIQFSHP